MCKRHSINHFIRIFLFFFFFAFVRLTVAQYRLSARQQIVKTNGPPNVVRIFNFNQNKTNYGEPKAFICQIQDSEQQQQQRQHQQQNKEILYSENTLR